MERRIVLVIAAASGHGTRRYDMGGIEELLPLVVESVDRAVSLLRQFRVDVVVFQPSEGREADALYTTLAEVAPHTPVLVYCELPSPRVLASVISGVLARSDTRAAGEACG
jgi:hypothetical protein